MSFGIVVYADGSCKGGNPGYAGWGVHGYMYEKEKPKKSGLNNGHVATADGYVLKSALNNNATVVEVTVKHYIDGFGSIGGMATNNVGELSAIIHTLSHALDFDIEELNIFTDSEYATKGINVYLPKWVQRNWIKSDNTPVANANLFREIMELKSRLEAKNVKVKIAWVKGHADILGNEIADRMANIGANASRKGQFYSSIETTVDTNNKYWRPEVDKHPFISNRRMYFNTLGSLIKEGEYYLGDHGKDDDMFGKEGVYSVIRLGTPDPALELLRKNQSTYARNVDSIVMARLDQLYKPIIYNQFMKYGELALEKDYERLDLLCMDDEPLTREFYPPKLALRAVNAIDDLSMRLDMYLNYDTGLVVTDITDVLYKKVEKKVKKDTVLKTELKEDYKVGHTSIKVNVGYQNDNEVSYSDIVLTLSVDMLERNALKRLEDLNPKVEVITWPEAKDAFRFATIITTAEGEKASIGIWCCVFSNLCIVKK